jgi:hypothetical protein
LDKKLIKKTTKEKNAGEWDSAGAVMFRNYAEALDANQERGRKVQEIAVKVFGSRENQLKVQTELRDACSEVVSSHLVREVTYNPVKPAGN